MNKHCRRCREEIQECICGLHYPCDNDDNPDDYDPKDPFALLEDPGNMDELFLYRGSVVVVHGVVFWN